jgi:hypothetical protein
MIYLVFGSRHRFCYNFKALRTPERVPSIVRLIRRIDALSVRTTDFAASALDEELLAAFAAAHGFVIAHAASSGSSVCLSSREVKRR